jgi:hypothetical protein
MDTEEADIWTFKGLFSREIIQAERETMGMQMDIDESSKI